MALVVLFLAGCNGCTPKLPPIDYGEDDAVDGREDSGGPVDTSTDTGPPAMCDVEEVEPNPFATPQPLPMETVACGYFDSSTDQEWFSFDLDEAGWLRVTAAAAARGSSANTRLTLSHAESDATLQVDDAFLTTDASAVFPVSDLGGYFIGVTEAEASSGEDFAWYLIASVTKPPLSWTFQEVEDNDDLASAEPLPMDDVVFGTLGVPEFGLPDEDWYVVHTPAGSADAPPDTAYATAIHFTMEGNSQGSPANPVLQMWSAEGELLFTDYSGELDYDLDPFHETKVTVAHEWYLSVTNETAGYGSPFHWYTLQVTAIYDEPDNEE